MKYRILNRLFGWDYVSYQWSAYTDSTKVSTTRLRVDGFGRPFIIARSGSDKKCIRFLSWPDSKTAYITCHPGKFFPKAYEDEINRIKSN